MGNPNCHANHGGDATRGQGLTVDMRMRFQKLNPQQEEVKFFSGPVKASCCGGERFSLLSGLIFYSMDKLLRRTLC